MLITKRDGRKVLFDVDKIKVAIQKAFNQNKKDIDDKMLTMLALRSFASAENKDKELTVENVQDAVERTLMECGFEDIAKSYILYRKQRENVRNVKLDVNKVVEGYLGEDDWRVKENSTVSYSLGGFILSNSGAVTANYWLNHYYDKEIADAHKNCDMHIHDLSMLSGYCFTGDTRISLSDGTFPTFEELVESGKTEAEVFSYDLANKKFVKAKAINIRKTRETNSLIYIRLNSGDEIRCTPDHKFLLANGTYEEAQNLCTNDHLMCINNEDDIYPEVVTITETDGLTPVYDLEVPEYNNFALDNGVIVHNCAGWSLKQLILEGLGGVENRISSKPAKHLHTLCNQMVNFLGIMQNEWAGAQAFSSFDTYLAAFVKKDNMSYKDVKQCIQSFVFGVNTPSRWGCVDTDTEVLSVDGFKKYDELKEGDTIYTWKDGKLNTNVVNKVIVKPYTGEMHSWKGRNYHQFVTPTHRMLVKKHNVDEYKIVHSEDIINSETPYPIPVMFNGSMVDSEVSLDINWVKFAAIVYADGSIDVRNESIHKITIYKSPNRFGVDLIRELSDKLGLTYTLETIHGGFDSEVYKFSYYGDSAKKITDVVGLSKKIIDQKFFKLNKEYSEVFLLTWAKFDGNYDKLMIQCDNEDIVNGIQHIAIRAGRTSYLRYKDKTVYVKLRAINCLYDIKAEKVLYDGHVWCPNVDDGTAIFRKDNSVFISGQTQAPFTNITLDWTCPEDLKDMPAIVGGEPQDFTYGDCQKEMDVVNKAFIDVMMDGDANGRGFQ